MLLNFYLVMIVKTTYLSYCGAGISKELSFCTEILSLFVYDNCSL